MSQDERMQTRPIELMRVQVMVSNYLPSVNK